jgi:hypothetical protein
MSKSKNKGSKKRKNTSDLLEAATVGLKQYRRFAKQVKKLSTTQKVVGGLAFLAAGFAYLTTTSEERTEPAPDPAAALKQPELPPDEGQRPGPPAGSAKPKRRKTPAPVKHVPFSEERP